MTVKMLQAWNGFPKDYIGAVISPAEETRLVNIGFASFDLDGVDNDNVLKPVMSKVNPVTGGITKIEVLTQAMYDALAVKDPETNYKIVAA